MPTLLNPRLINSFIVLSVIALLGYALYTEHYLGLVPCPLCLTQRFFFALTGLVALIALLHNPRSWAARLYGLLLVICAGLGAGVAGRQVWMQFLPEDQVPACGPTLEYMLDAFPFSEALKLLFMGDGNCAEVHWTFLGMSMPTWALIWFVFFVLLGLWQLLRQPR